MADARQMSAQIAQLWRRLEENTTRRSRFITGNIGTGVRVQCRRGYE